MIMTCGRVCISRYCACVLYMTTFSGQSPADAELNYIDNAKKLAMYGVHLHEAKVL